jgi:hypothetical protein
MKLVLSGQTCNYFAMLGAPMPEVVAESWPESLARKVRRYIAHDRRMLGNASRRAHDSSGGS